MPRVRNAFKIRAADTPIVETSQFLQLYCPFLLNQFQRDDLFVPKLFVVRGSPGSGKSSLLRLFETDTLLAIHARRSQPSDQDLIDRLQELGVITDDGPKLVGIYIQCDSSLRDIWNVSEQTSLGLFNALLDTRIVASFLRSIRRLQAAKCLPAINSLYLEGLPSDDAPPTLLGQKLSLNEMEDLCLRIERDFGTLLNSFPGDPLPPLIQPHSRVYAPAYLALQVQMNPILTGLMPMIMLDDFQGLYPEQRSHLNSEFLRRSAIPRWLAVRTHVFGLEELISLTGAQEGREYRELPLDEIFQERPGVFTKFSTNVVHRRLQATEYLESVTVNDFKGLLKSPEDIIPAETATRAVEGMIEQAKDLRIGLSVIGKLRNALEGVKQTAPTVEAMKELERALIVAKRQANKRQLTLFPEMELPESSDSKTIEAARLFLTRRARWPYYFGFDNLTNAASGNIQQMLAITAKIIDRMVYRAELDRNLDMTAKEQEEILRKCAQEYYEGLVSKQRYGSATRQFVDNLGKFCEEVTYRQNAPIAPGVNGFGLTREEILNAISGEKKHPSAFILREVITSAVAENVLSVRLTKQGQAGSEKVVFYLNRLLCIKFRLPLNYGGWQHIPVDLLVKMMQEPVSVQDISRKGVTFSEGFWESEETTDG